MKLSKKKIMKYYMSFLLLIILPISAYNQDLKIGVFLEPQLSWLGTQSKNIEYDGTHLGFRGGIVLDKYFANRYAINTGISIGNQGGSLMFLNPDSTDFKVLDEELKLPEGTTVDFSLQYVTIPLALKLRTNQIGYFTYFARVGLLSQINVLTKGTSSDGQFKKDNINKEINTFNISYFFGGGAEYEIGQGTSVFLEASFYNGFTDAMTNKSIKAYSRIVSIRTGIIF